MKQINISVVMGMGKNGKERARLYRERSKARGYKSLSAFVVQLVDRELDLKLPIGKRRGAPEVRIPVRA